MSLGPTNRFDNLPEGFDKDKYAAAEKLSTENSVAIGLLLPDVMGTYGDDGNAVVLRQRLRLRGIAAHIVPITLDEVVPESCDIYTLGGGEDAAQTLAARHLSATSGLRNAVANGAPLLGICAGMQVLGDWFVVSDGSRCDGVGLIDLTTVSQQSRSIGELVTNPLHPELSHTLTGFENHMGATVLGTDASPLGKVTYGVGNGVPAGDNIPSSGLVDGAVSGRVITTYMHGPLLARNPELADLILAQATGLTLDPLEIDMVDTVREERIAAAKKAS